jgi:hypothetical protein
MGKKRSPRKEVLKSVTGPEDTSLKQEIKFILPPGTKLSDIYMDAQDLAQELKIGKRLIYELRREGSFSFTTLGIKGKVFYFRQEIAATLHSNKIAATKNLLAALKKRK